MHQETEYILRNLAVLLERMSNEVKQHLVDYYSEIKDVTDVPSESEETETGLGVFQSVEGALSSEPSGADDVQDRRKDT
tara:strand:- start:3529 stop:3765 length:237 start_codon:yes stop_codon:yes gene_type:complete